MQNKPLKILLYSLVALLLLAFGLIGYLLANKNQIKKYAIDQLNAQLDAKITINNIDITRGKILSREMKSAKMKDILDVWIENYGGEWEHIQGRPGERNDEFLVGETELEYCERLVINGINHFLIDPNKKAQTPMTEIFTSENADRLTKSEILEIIQSGKDV
jgi:hypothetical protein